jgi:tellurite resistance protein TerC
MANLWDWLQSPAAWVLLGFHAFIGLVLAIDLGVFNRKSHVVSMRQAGAWSLVWLALAGLFAVGIWQCWGLWQPDRPEQGGAKALEFITGYVVEQSLSVDNLFVFLVIFRYFGVPVQFRHRVLVWGILGAVVMRAAFILAGAAILNLFHWMNYVFAAFLVYTGYKLGRSVDEEVDPGRNPLLRLARRFVPVVDNYDSPHFWVKRDGRWHATPLPLILLVVETTDVMFALDSIPAIFGITRDPFIVYTSNIFAIIGLRSLFFLLAGFLGMFRYLNVGLSAVMTFVGIKMIVEELFRERLEALGVGHTQLIFLSLGVIGLILGTTVVASLLVGPAQEGAAPAEQPPADPGAHG